MARQWEVGRQWEGSGPQWPGSGGGSGKAVAQQCPGSGPAVSTKPRKKEPRAFYAFDAVDTLSNRNPDDFLCGDPRVQC